jgi:hypothetical protein
MEKIYPNSSLFDLSHQDMFYYVGMGDTLNLNKHKLHLQAVQEPSPLGHCFDGALCVLELPDGPVPCPRLASPEKLRQRRHSPFNARLVEHRDGDPAPLGVRDHPVLDAGVGAVGEDVEDVAHVDDQGARQRPHGEPPAAPLHLQARRVVDLQQQGQAQGVGVRRDAHHRAPVPARWVVVHGHALALPIAGAEEGTQERLLADAKVGRHGAQQAPREILDLHGVPVERAPRRESQGSTGQLMTTIN